MTTALIRWLLLVVLCMASLAQAAEAQAGREAQWRQMVQSVSTTPPARNSQASLRRALEALRLLGWDKGAHRQALEELQQDTREAYFDVARVHDGRVLERALRLLDTVHGAWIAEPGKELLRQAASDLQQAVTQAAEVALTDAGLLGTETLAGHKAQPPPGVRPEAWEEARQKVQQAQSAWQQARGQLELGEQQAAGPHLLATWKRALEALHAVGVRFAPRTLTDVDRDGVPDQLEVRWGASPLSQDTDGDGLSDLFECHEGGVHLLPSRRDTDGNGVADGLEDPDRDGYTNQQEQQRGTDPLSPLEEKGAFKHSATRGRTRHKPERTPPPQTPPTDKAPCTDSPCQPPPEEDLWEVRDTDGDGLEDADERLLGSSNTLEDTDGDGLKDGEELDHATDLDARDTDGDGFSDAYEVRNRARGFDALKKDTHKTAEQWGREYSDGLLLGDTCDTLFSGWKPCAGTVPFFLGQLSGGAASFIPVVGWVVGTLGDIRDTLGNVAKSDWVGAGLSAVGLLPYVGDAASLAGKVVAFVRRYAMLEQVLYAVLVRLPRVLAAGPGIRHLPSADAATLGETARALVLEVLQKLNPEGFADLRRYGNDEFLTRLAAWGASWKDMAQLFTQLEHSGLFSDYPRMRSFIEEMIRTTPVEALQGAGDILSLNRRVTLNLKKAALRMQYGPPKYLETVRNHLRSALAEHAAALKLPADQVLIHLGPVTANGTDWARRFQKLIDVVEVKATSKVGFHEISNWIKRTVDPKTGEALYVFNGIRLKNSFAKAGHNDLRVLLNDRELRFNLFVYDKDARLTEELWNLFKSGKTKIPVDDIQGLEITLTWTKHWDP